MEIQTINLSEIAESVAEDLRGRPWPAPIEIKVQPEMSATADPGLIRILYDNAIENACKYSPRGAPIAVRFPRGGVGLVIGVSLLVFALYYVGLIGGESLANEGIIPPFWAMWGTNVILTVVGIGLLLRMGNDSTSNRGGDWSDKLDALLAKFGRGPQARLRSAP